MFKKNFGRPKRRGERTILFQFEIMGSLYSVLECGHYERRSRKALGLSNYQRLQSRRWCICPECRKRILNQQNSTTITPLASAPNWAQVRFVDTEN